MKETISISWQMDGKSGRNTEKRKLEIRKREGRKEEGRKVR